jgi:hypothetical protein
MTKHLLLAAALVLTTACAAQPPVLAVRNLERPNDMGFVCMAVTSDGKLSGRPMIYCHPRPSMLADPIPVLGKGRPFGTFGLVPNTARGELAVVDMDPVLNVLVDLDPGQPGYNMVPLGDQPEVLSVSQDGCRAVTANRGSCDLGLVDPQRMLSPYFGVPSATGTGDVVTRVRFKTTSGELNAAPAEISFLPQPLPDLQNQVKSGIVCSDQNVADNGPYSQRPWRAVVTFPGCDLVAMVELPSGQIVSSVYIRPDGAVDAGTNPVCPSECGSRVTTESDAGAPAGDGGVTLPDQHLRVSAMALRPDGRRVYVGAVNADFITALDIDPPVSSSVAGTTGIPTETGTSAPPGQTGSVSRFGLFVPADGGRIVLHESPGGVTRLRLSVDTFAPTDDGKTMGSFVGLRGQYLYAIARDGSMRLVSVQNGGVGGVKEHECEANADPLFVTSQSDCYPVDGTVPRRPLVQGPGIHVPQSPLLSPDLPPAVPRDIGFAAVSILNGASQAITQPDPPFSGAFGYVLTSTTNVYVLNIQPSTATPEVMNHTFVNAYRGDINHYPPYFSTAPLRDFSGTVTPLPFLLPPALPPRSPRLESYPGLDGSGNQIALWAGFPDPGSLLEQNWALVWEGPLQGASRYTGQLLGPIGPGSAGALTDVSTDYCASGVLKDDILLLPGCSVDADCITAPPLNPQQPPPQAAYCRQALPGAPGLCFPVAQAADDRLLARCRRHMSSRRRYTVTVPGSNNLQLALKLDEVPKSTLDRCTKNTDCRPEGAAPFAKFTCESVRPGEYARCIQHCGGARGQPDDSQCRLGMVCENVPGTTGGPLCVEGPPIDQACWPVQSTYRVLANQSFLVSGQRLPVPPVARLQNGQCVEDVSRHQLLVNRIPLSAPACQGLPPQPDSDADLQTHYTTTLLSTKAILPGAAAGTRGDPCLFKAPNDDEFPADIHTVGDPPVKVRPSHTKAFFQNQQIKLMLTNLEEYTGDASTIQFQITGGFRAAAVATRDESLIITAGARITVGPTAAPESPMNYGLRQYYPYIYVVDQGRSASVSTGRGQILRIDPTVAPSGIPVFDSTNFTTTPFQIQ